MKNNNKKNKGFVKVNLLINTFYLIAIIFIVWSGITLTWMRFMIGILLMVITMLMHFQVIKLENKKD